MHYSIGIDVGGTTIKGGIVDTKGNIILAGKTVPTPISGASLVCDSVSRMVSYLKKEADKNCIKLIPTVGVCIPGIVDEKAGLGIFSANLNWRNVPFTSMLSKRIGGAVALGHDVRSGALAEARWGAGSDTCLYVAIGTGIASGLVVHGSLVPAPQWAGEIGQIMVDDPFNLGSRITMESFASAKGIARQAEILGLVSEGAGAKEVSELARLGIKEAMEILDRSMRCLGRVLAIVLHQLGAMPVIIGGGLSQGGSFVFDPLRDQLAKDMTIMPVSKVLPAELGANSQMLGAAALAFDA